MSGTVTIKCPIISVRSPVSCFLGDHVQCGRPITGGGANDAELQHVVKLRPSNSSASEGVDKCVLTPVDLTSQYGVPRRA